MVEKRYATFWRRVGADYIDGLIFLLVGWLHTLVILHAKPLFLRSVVDLAGNYAFLAYSIWMHGKFGQTVGKMICRVIVLDLSEKPLSMRQAVAREYLNVALVPLTLLLGLQFIFREADPETSELGKRLFPSFMSANLIWVSLEIITMLTNDKRRAFARLYRWFGCDP